MGVLDFLVFLAIAFVIVTLLIKAGGGFEVVPPEPIEEPDAPEPDERDRLIEFLRGMLDHEKAVSDAHQKRNGLLYKRSMLARHVLCGEYDHMIDKLLYDVGGKDLDDEVEDDGHCMSRGCPFPPPMLPEANQAVIEVYFNQAQSS